MWCARAWQDQARDFPQAGHRGMGNAPHTSLSTTLQGLRRVVELLSCSSAMGQRNFGLARTSTSSRTGRRSSPARSASWGPTGTRWQLSTSLLGAAPSQQPNWGCSAGAHRVATAMVLDPVPRGCHRCFLGFVAHVTPFGLACAPPSQPSGTWGVPLEAGWLHCHQFEVRLGRAEANFSPPRPVGGQAPAGTHRRGADGRRER